MPGSACNLWYCDVHTCNEIPCALWAILQYKKSNAVKMLCAICNAVYKVCNTSFHVQIPALCICTKHYRSRKPCANWTLNIIVPKCIFAKCTRLACLLSFASLSLCGPYSWIYVCSGWLCIVKGATNFTSGQGTALVYLRTIKCITAGLQNSLDKSF